MAVALTTAGVWTRGLVALAAAVAATLVVRATLASIVDVPEEFTPLAWQSVLVVTVACTIAATAAFDAVRRRARNPVRAYWRVAAVALVLSFAPPFLLLVAPGSVTGVTVAGVASLVALHVAAAAAIVPALTWRVG